MFPIEDGDALRQWREAQFLSQTQLATLLGVHVKTIYNWEQGNTRLPQHTMLALEQISGNRERVVRRLRREQEKLAHKRHLKEIAQGIPEKKAALKAQKKAAS
jgi:predicted transcriptional regulator